MTDASAHTLDEASDLADRKTRFVTVRCSLSQRQQMKAIAAGQGFSIGAYIRLFMLNTPGPRSRRRPSLDREQLGRILGHVGHLGANINQISKALHTAQDIPAQVVLARAAADIAAMRQALMQALGRQPAPIGPESGKACGLADQG